MKWWSRYVGIPFSEIADEGSHNCWSICRAVYNDQLGIVLPDYGEISADDLLAVAKEIDGGQERWDTVDEPQPFDIVLMRLYDRAWVGHVGILISTTEFLHIEKATDSVIVPLNHFSIRNRIAGYRRYRTIGKDVP